MEKTAKIDDLAIVENGSTIISGQVIEVGPGYLVIDRIPGALTQQGGWRIMHVLTPEEINGDEGPLEMQYPTEGDENGRNI